MKRDFRASVLTLSGSFALLLPFFINLYFLDQKILGLWMVCIAYFMLSNISELGFSISIQKRIINNDPDYKIYLKTSVIFTAVFASCIALIVFIFLNYVKYTGLNSAIVNSPGEFTIALLLVALGVVFSSITPIFHAVFYAKDRAEIVAVIRVISATLQIIFLFIFYTFVSKEILVPSFGFAILSLIEFGFSNYLVNKLFGKYFFSPLLSIRKMKQHILESVKYFYVTTISTNYIRIVIIAAEWFIVGRAEKGAGYEIGLEKLAQFLVPLKLAESGFLLVKQITHQIPGVLGRSEQSSPYEIVKIGLLTGFVGFLVTPIFFLYLPTDMLNGFQIDLKSMALLKLFCLAFFIRLYVDFQQTIGIYRFGDAVPIAVILAGSLVFYIITFSTGFLFISEWAAPISLIITFISMSLIYLFRYKPLKQEKTIDLMLAYGIMLIVLFYAAVNGFNQIKLSN